MLVGRLEGSVVPGVEPELVPEGEPGRMLGELGLDTPLLDEREGPIWTGRDDVDPNDGVALGRAEGMELGRTLPLEPRDGLGAAEGREEPPLEGRGAALEPREPWLEGRADPPPDPREGEADDPEEPLEPRCGSARSGLADPARSRKRASLEKMFVFMFVPKGMDRTVESRKTSAGGLRHSYGRCGSGASPGLDTLRKACARATEPHSRGSSGTTSSIGFGREWTRTYGIPAFAPAGVARMARSTREASTEGRSGTATNRPARST